jgi:putative ATP-dependent endonuclease of OLD family
LALVGLSDEHGTTVSQPHALDAGASFRAVSEIDAERGELFLASAVMLVEGRTEKLTLPFFFAALGHDADREAITIVDCGGKPNIPLFIRICHAVGVPCVAIHDRDALPGREPSHAERAINAEIRSLAGADCAFELARDFEGVAGLRGHRHKPTQAYNHFHAIGADGVPAPLRDAVHRAVALARR